MSELVYRAPQPVSDREAMDAIAQDDVEALQLLPINLGFHHENWRFIQDICVRLSSHRDPWVRSNSLLGLSYAARFRGKIEKNVVKPVLLRALQDSDPRVASTARDAIDDINRLMHWRIGGASRQKMLEARYEIKRKAPNQRSGDHHPDFMTLWESCRPHFEPEGALRDIYVHGTTKADWQRCYELMLTYQPEYSVDGQPMPLPPSADEVLAIRSTARPLLHFLAGKAAVACHFFADDEIEMDVDPRDIIGSPANFEGLLTFLQMLGDTLGKTVLLSYENDAQNPFLTYEPDGKLFRHHDSVA